MFTEDPKVEEWMAEIAARLDLLERSLPHRVDAMVSPESKLPFIALQYRAGLAWRMAELSRSAFEGFEANRLVSAILLTRASVETGAGLWYLSAKIDAAVERGTLGDSAQHLRRLHLGSKRNPAMPEAVNVLNFVDRVERDVKGFREQYDMLSEYAHPNWCGTAHLYSKPDPPNLWTDFGANIRGATSARCIGVANLSTALMFFEISYNRIADAMPAFIELCEAAGPFAGDEKPEKATE